MFLNSKEIGEKIYTDISTFFLPESQMRVRAGADRKTESREAKISNLTEERRERFSIP